MTVTNSFHVNDSTYTATLSNITELTFTITVKDVVPLSQIYWAFDFYFSDSANSNGYTGLQPVANLAGGGMAPALNLSVWNATSGTAGSGSTIEPFVETGNGMRITHAEPIATGVSYTIDLKIADGQLIETETDQSGNSVVIGSIAAPAATFSGSLDYFSEYWGPQNSMAYPPGQVQIGNVLVNGLANKLLYNTTYLSDLDQPNNIPSLYAAGPDGYYDSSIGPAGTNLSLNLQSENATVGGGVNLNTVIIGKGVNDLRGDVFQNIQQIDGGGQTLTLNAAQTALHMVFKNATLAISDSAENVAIYLSSLQALAAAGRLSSITLTDSATPTLRLSATEQINDAAALSAIVSPYHLSTVSARPDIVSMSAVTADQTQTITLSGSGFGSQAAYDGVSSTIKISDLSNSWEAGWGTDWISLSVASWTDDRIVLSGFSGQYGSTYGMLHLGDLLAITVWNPQDHIQSQTVDVTVSAGGDTVAQALASYAAGTAAGALPIADNGAAFQASLTSLQAMAAAGKLGSVTFTDFGTPNLALSAAQLVADSTALADISSDYTVTVSGVTAANADAVARQSHVLSLTVNDSAADISANIDSLNALVAAGSVTSIAPTDSGGGTLSLTAAQLNSDAAALGAVSGTYQLSIDASAATTTISGVPGHGNTVVFSGTASQYSITANIDGGGLTVAGSNSTAHLTNVTALQFSDVIDIVATPPGHGVVTTGNITELYAAVFARQPDIGGLVFYQNYLIGNPTTSLLIFSEWFLSSTEYRSNPAHNYSQTTGGDAQFISDSYQNLLHRAPSASEVAFYQTNVMTPALANLTPGTQAYSNAELQAHAQMLVYFSVSPEFLGQVQVTAQTPSDTHHWLILI